MKMKVYFARVERFEDQEEVRRKIIGLFMEAGFSGLIKPGEKVGVKITFGEEGNKGYIRPEYVGQVVTEVKASGGKPFVTDANTIYKGRRANAIDHLNLAREHGFSHDAVGAPLVIADGLIGDDFEEVQINKKHFQTVKIASFACQCDCIIGLAHLTGHMLTGVGATIKNIGMGLASRAGKRAQHSEVAPVVKVEICNGCGVCVDVCPVGAIALVKKKSYIHKERCIGCGECILRCKAGALDLNWSVKERGLQERMAEYTYGVLKDKKDKVGFMNFINRVTAECDCLARDEPEIVQDIGILASTDPVALDKAAIDLAIQRAGSDIFLKAHPKADWKIQLECSAKLGLGSMDYELIEV